MSVNSTYLTEKNDQQRCILCWEDMQNLNSVKPKNCIHCICIDCTSAYFDQIQNHNLTLKSCTVVPCPSLDCQGGITPDDVLPIIFKEKKELISRWWFDVLRCNLNINTFTCPFQDCDAVYDLGKKRLTKCTFGTCYDCGRAFCLICHERWHPGVIKYYENEQEEKEFLMRAKSDKCCQCPRCKILVNKLNGCNHMTCVCGAEFCYVCGGMNGRRGRCANDCYLLSTESLETLRNAMFGYKQPN